MSVFDEQPPLINVSNFCQWLKKNYSFFKSKNIKLSRLNSERDINFLIKGIGTKKYVVKISNPKESLNQLEYQDLLINHLKLNSELKEIYPEILHKKILLTKKLDSVKEIYIQKLQSSRKIDSIKGSISYGPNKSDLKVVFLKKKKLAEKCSTGEQKIILISLIIQFCKLMNNKGNFPILLLDEIVAHLDNKIKISLFEELKTLKNQVWMSGSDKSLFSDIIKEKEVVNLEIEDLLKQ